MDPDEESGVEQSVVAVTNAVLEPFSQGTFHNAAPALAQNVQAADNGHGGGVMIWIMDCTHAFRDWLRGLDLNFFKRNERTGVDGTT